MSILDIFRKGKKVENEILSRIKDSFVRVKNDNEILYQWVNYLNQKLHQSEQKIHAMHSYIDALKPSKESVKSIIDEYHLNLGLLDRLKSIEQRIESLYHHGTVSSSTLTELHKKIDLLEQKKQALKSRIIQKITGNSKDYVKSLILETISKHGEISANEIRTLIVEEKGLCSKSSFYRILEEIEQTTSIGVARVGREKHYISKVTSP